MQLQIRRVGNSLGVILPKSVLAEWGVGEGDALELTQGGIAPPSRGGRSQVMLDELKRLLSLAVIRHFSPQEIRAQSIANLYRWKRQGTWVSAYDHWTEILQRGSDGELFNAMLVAEIVMMAMGFAWLAMLIGPEKSWQFGVVPFIVGDLIKVALAATLMPAAWSLLLKQP